MKRKLSTPYQYNRANDKVNACVFTKSMLGVGLPRLRLLSSRDERKNFRRVSHDHLTSRSGVQVVYIVYVSTKLALFSLPPQYSMPIKFL
jgi:hypothetical protein